MPFWTERMTTAYLSSRQQEGAQAAREGNAYKLKWNDEEIVENAVFRREEAADESTTLISLGDPRLRAMLSSIPIHAPGQPIPSITVPDVSDKTSGIWSLWRVSLDTPQRRDIRYVPVFLSDDGRSFATTARIVWDRVIALDFSPVEHVDALAGAVAVQKYTEVKLAALELGAPVFEQMTSRHEAFLKREKSKGERAFASRKNAISHIGLPAVREHRLRALADEERAWRDELAMLSLATPDLSSVMMVRVNGAAR
jgi:hypothetical protein